MPSRAGGRGAGGGGGETLRPRGLFFSIRDSEQARNGAVLQVLPRAKPFGGCGGRTLSCGLSASHLHCFRDRLEGGLDHEDIPAGEDDELLETFSY